MRTNCVGLCTGLSLEPLCQRRVVGVTMRHHNCLNSAITQDLIKGVTVRVEQWSGIDHDNVGVANDVRTGPSICEL